MHAIQAKPFATLALSSGPARLPLQRGVALFIVMVLVLLTTLLVLWSTRSALLNEIVTGNDADYQRAFEAAQALLRDAELDIIGVQADGSTAIPRCGQSGALASCRPDALPAEIKIGAKKVYFPSSYSLDDDDGGDLMVLESLIPKFDGVSGGCVAAICVGGITRVDVTPTAAEEGEEEPETPSDNKFWTNTALLEKMKAAAGTYGQYTGAKLANDAGLENPLLSTAWYWVEPLRYEANLAANAASRFAPRGSGTGNATGIVFRITAYAEGRKPGTQVVVQNIFVKKAQPPADGSGS